jgi:branched-chain amino acid transport system permease protein
MELVTALAMNGIVWGLIIALIALGLSIIFGLLDIIYIAHGDFFMVGTVLAWAVFELTGNYWLAFLIVPVLGFGLGALIEFTVIAPIKNAAALSIVATFGLSVILQEGVRATYGAAPRWSSRSRSFRRRSPSPSSPAWTRRWASTPPSPSPPSSLSWAGALA